MGQNESRIGKPPGSYNSKFTNEKTRSSRAQAEDRQFDSRKEVLKSTVASNQSQKQTELPPSTNSEPPTSGQYSPNLNQQDISFNNLSSESIFGKVELGKLSQADYKLQNTSKIDDSHSFKQTVPVQELSFINPSIVESTKNEVLTSLSLPSITTDTDRQNVKSQEPLPFRDASTVQEMNSNSYSTLHHQDTSTPADLSDVRHEPDPTSTWLMQTQDGKVSTTVSGDIRHIPLSTNEVSPQNNLSDENSLFKAKPDAEITENDDLSHSASNDTLLTSSADDDPTKEFFTGNPLFIQIPPKISAVGDGPSSSKTSKRREEQNLQLKKKMNPNFNDKRNISKIIGTKGHCTKTSSTTKALKHFEQLADKLSGVNIDHGVTKRSRNIGTKLFHVDKSPTTEHFKSGTCSKIPLDECITRVKNINANNGELDPFLQLAIIEHLQNINTLVSVLKTQPILETKIATQINALRDNVLSLKTSKLDLKEQFSNSPVKCTNPFLDYNNTSNQVIQNVSNPSLEIREIVDNETTEGQQTISILSFKSLMDTLAYEFEEDKPYISLQGAQLYCRICEKPISFSLFNLEEHLRGKKHKAVLVESSTKNKFTSEASVTNLTINTGASDDSALPEAIRYNNTKSPSNYEGALNIIIESYEHGLVVPFTIFICRPCDFLTNKEEDAMAHLNESTHVSQQLLDAKWHICNSCCLHIYGTDDHIKEHCLTLQHNNVLILKKNKGTGEIIMEKDEQGQESSIEADQASISSSASDLTNRNSNLKPHAILLTVSKDRLLQKNYSPIGLFCQICNKYTLYNRSKSDHFLSETHIKKLKTKHGNKLNKHYCSSCRVHVFGNENIFEEHIALPLHQEMSSFVENNVDNLQADAGSDTDEQIPPEELSDESGPHYELMKDVLKKHINLEQTTNLFGFYCHICQYCSQQLTQWEAHLNSASHSNRINSAECAKNMNMYHTCEVCNICLICDESVLSLHERCFAHKAILKKLQARPQYQELPAGHKEQQVSQEHCNKQQEQEEALSEDTDSSEEEDADDSQSTSSSIANGNKPEVMQKRRIKNGVYVKGLSPNTEQKDVFEAFKKFGFITRCNIDQRLHTATVNFQKIVEANNVLSKKEFYIRDTPVTLCPLLSTEKFKRRRGKRSNSTNDGPSLPRDVVSAVQSPFCLQDLLARLKAELQEEAIVWSQKSSLIMNDIYQVVANCRVLFFGSRVTGLATKNSDCDIFIYFDLNAYNNDISQKDQEGIIRHLLQIFTQPRSKFRVIEPVFDARVPIIRVIHNRTEIPCDISCRSGISVENSLLIRFYVESDPRVYELVILVKWWMKANNLLDRNIFTSYTTTWMVLFFLMQNYTLKIPILCPVSYLQKNCPPKFISCWDCRFARVEERFRTANRQPVRELLNLFFWFYGDLTYKGVVLCPLTGFIIQRSHFDQLNLPQEFAPYIRRLKTVRHAEVLRTATPICIQDPFDLSHNISKGVGRKDLKIFKTLCQQSAKMSGGVRLT